MTISILIVDDQPLLRQGFRMILSAQPDLAVVGEAGDGSEAVRLTRQLQPDVVLMDVRMPKLDGIGATRQIVAAGGASRILVVTTFEHDEYVFEALRAGASGFVVKRVLPQELIQAVRIVATGESLVFPSLTRQLVERHSVRLDANDRRGLLISQLTDREGEILRLIAGGQSNAEIAAALVVAVHTVKTHVAHILGKLEVRDRTQAVIFAYETGFVRTGE